MRSWVFRNRLRLEAIYGRLAARRVDAAHPPTLAPAGTDREGLAVFVLLPTPRRISSPR